MEAKGNKKKLNTNPIWMKKLEENKKKIKKGQ